MSSRDTRKIGVKARSALALSGLACVVALLTAPVASAATEFGSNCTATSGAPEVSFVSLAHGAGSPLPAAAPVSGVITRWSSNVAVPIPPEAAFAYVQKLLLLRPTGAPNQFVLAGESASAGVLPGANSFLTRIPVKAGDHLGLGGTYVGLYCSTGDGADVMGYNESEAGPVPGGAISFKSAPGNQIPAAATIEPDVDGDGYGDETQDGCPQSALYQTACPVVKLDAFTQVGGKAVTVTVVTSLSAPVKVSGSVDLGKGPAVKLAAKSQTVVAGKLGKFKLQFPSALKEKLKEMGPGQKLTLKLTASATNLSGPVSSDKLKAKLKGQG